MKKPIVEIKNLKKVIGDKTIIHGISMDVFPGEVFGFLGPNGAGKTTTIRMMVGLMGITEGEVLINGFSIEKNFEKAISHVGGIIENPEMYKFLSGYDNLLQYARMLPDPVKKERIDEIVNLVGLEKRIHEKVKGYSLGMRQRLGLAQALLHSPALLILDEPTNGLDPAGIREIRTYIRKIAHEEGIAVFVSSHMLSEMQLMCDRIGIIQDGHLVSVETVGDFVGEKVNTVLEIEPIEKAREFVEQTFPELNPKVNGAKLFVSASREKVPSLVKALAENEFEIYQVSSENSTLEEKFLEMTEGK
ncbi:ABC transporter ATP-binding protein [Bacillus sp. ISL-37]|jgi:ABC-2 type transport system ATP-binding protein|uniref:ABC transporter ATP-binding protein n=1 Tax=Bacillus sp. ISL-37 TaxID=2819123 RepID=UPI001BEA4A95|nr:ABC transporter ATP-binding protein [Bacillus sp. ISL-37]MBT2684987.1 ABC transporter ATP-binding protein [Bacillus sp. ISL-37]